jgi:hypothetical protein
LQHCGWKGLDAAARSKPVASKAPHQALNPARAVEASVRQRRPWQQQAAALSLAVELICTCLSAFSRQHLIPRVRHRVDHFSTLKTLSKPKPTTFKA